MDTKITGYRNHQGESLVAQPQFGLGDSLPASKRAGAADRSWIGEAH